MAGHVSQQVPGYACGTGGNSGAGSLTFMAELATGRSVVLAMASNAPLHGGNIFHLRDDIHFGNRAVAILALQARLKVRAMAPVHVSRYAIDAHPRNGLLRLRIRGEFLDRRTVLRNRSVAGH